MRSDSGHMQLPETASSNTTKYSDKMKWIFCIVNYDGRENGFYVECLT